MKKILSVFYLASSTSFWRILAVLAALAVTQLLAAYWMLRKALDTLALEQILDHPVYRFAPSVALTLATLLLLSGHGGARSRVNYTMARLSLPARSILLIHGAYCVGIYLLFWLSQVCLAMATATMFRAMVPVEYTSVQLELLTCYRSVYLHPLLPLADWPFWVITPLIVLGLGINTTLGLELSWAGRFPFSPVIFSLLTALYAAKPGNYTWAILLLLVLLFGVGGRYYQSTLAKGQEVVP